MFSEVQSNISTMTVLKQYLDIKFDPGGVGPDEHVLAEPVEGVVRVVERVHVRIPENRRCKEENCVR